MLVDLIRLTAADGMELDGAFFEPSADVAPDGPIDAVLCIHGSGRNFYTAATANMANDLRNRRRDRALIKAPALPVKLVFPLVICFLPGIFVVTLGPAFREFFNLAQGVISGVR